MQKRLCRLLAVLALCLSSNLSANHSWPEPRWGHLFVYFPPTDSIVLFGGASERGRYRQDMWLWNGDNWQQLDVPVPTARGFAAATYDPGRQVILLHGGRGNDRVTYQDLWAWDGQSWQLLDEEGPFKSDHHQMAYSPELEGVLLFGGWTGDGVSGETWVWSDGWTQKAAAKTPSPRSAFGMAYNPLRNRVELFGGLWINGQYADTWFWQSDEWQLLSGPYENSSLDHLTMFFDSDAQEMLIFGGKDYRRSMRGEIRRFDHNGLVSATDIYGPQPRHSVNIAYDLSQNRGLLFGGKIYQGEEQLPLGDLWIWENQSWREILPEADE